MGPEGRESLKYCYSSIMRTILSRRKLILVKIENIFQVDIDSVNKKKFNGNHIVRTLRCRVFKLPADATKNSEESYIFNFDNTIFEKGNNMGSEN